MSNVLDGWSGGTAGRTGIVAELWYEAAPDLSDPRLVETLTQVAPGTELNDGAVTIPHSGVSMETGQGTVLLATAVLPGSPLGVDGKSLPDAGQTWDWEGAESAVRRCRHSVVVTELMADLFAPRQRVGVLTSVLAVVVECTAPRAISWPQSQRLTDPAHCVVDGLDGPLNVRLFATDDALVMDTLGLHVFDLPDIQCHFRGVAPSEIATMLFNTGSYVFDHGDVIDDGNTISGVRGDEHFVCRNEESLIGPRRWVIDVNLGEPYAAGTRR